MKTLYISDRVGGHIIFDEETKELSNLDSEREAVSWVRTAPEDMKLVYVKENGENETLDIKKGQMIIRFYESYFPHRVIVVDSNEWLENITEYNKKMKDRHNENTLKTTCDLESCDACCKTA